MLSSGMKSMESALLGIKKYTDSWKRYSKSRCDKLSCCARQARKLVKLIRDDLEANNQPYSGSRFSIIPLISKQCKDDVFEILNDGDEKYLTVYKCNCIALLIMDEAFLQIDETLMIDSDLNTNVKKVLDSLYIEFKNSEKYSSQVFSLHNSI